MSWYHFPTSRRKKALERFVEAVSAGVSRDEARDVAREYSTKELERRAVWGKEIEENLASRLKEARKSWPKENL